MSRLCCEKVFCPPHIFFISVSPPLPSLSRVSYSTFYCLTFWLSYGGCFLPHFLCPMIPPFLASSQHFFDLRQTRKETQKEFSSNPYFPSPAPTQPTKFIVGFFQLLAMFCLFLSSGDYIARIIDFSLWVKIY